jgi:flagellar biosynthesis/type III secretory pathway chaperone
VKQLNKDHHDIIDHLMAAIEEVDQLYLELLKALDCERASLAAVNLPDFIIANEQKEMLLKRLQESESRRMQQTAQLSQALGLPGKEVTLSRLARRLDGKEAARLLSGGDKLAKILARIRESNRFNRRLISGSLGFVKDSLQMLQNLKRPSPTYHSNGQMTHGACRGTILAGEI